MKLYFISVYEKSRNICDYIEGENLMDALKKFHLLHNVDNNYNDMHIKRIYRNMQMRHSIEQIARRNGYIINQLKQKEYENRA